MEVVGVWKKVFGNLKYLALALLVGLIFYGFNVLVVNYQSLIGFYSSLGFLGILKLIFNLSVGFAGTVELHSFVSLVIISLMFGMLFSLLVFKIRAGSLGSGKRFGALGSVGVALGALAPGCAACGVGLLAVLGLSSAFLTFLPFDGLEISILAIGILGFVIYRTSKDVGECQVCKVKLDSRD
ncbi:hypothetical protein CMI47_17510 [Candidatus Pacearchaeota archaeon]|nr:hypothetical protein [Candidatus Pacearchaeota archaeon]|tara:strand:+ start:7235 stop:7783 length:549 start_codon:yes stop_codon:yes gene_type:complete